MHTRLIPRLVCTVSSELMICSPCTTVKSCVLVVVCYPIDQMCHHCVARLRIAPSFSVSEDGGAAACLLSQLRLTRSSTTRGKLDYRNTALHSSHRFRPACHIPSKLNYTRRSPFLDLPPPLALRDRAPVRITNRQQQQNECTAATMAPSNALFRIIALLLLIYQACATAITPGPVILSGELTSARPDFIDSADFDFCSVCSTLLSEICPQE